MTHFVCPGQPVEALREAGSWGQEHVRLCFSRTLSWTSGGSAILEWHSHHPQHVIVLSLPPLPRLHLWDLWPEAFLWLVSPGASCPLW